MSTTKRSSARGRWLVRAASCARSEAIADLSSGFEKSDEVSRSRSVAHAFDPCRPETPTSVALRSSARNNSPGVTEDRDVRLAFSRDSSGLVMIPEAVGRPTSRAETIDIIRAAAEEGTCVTPAGSQTGYVGGSITDKGILLSLARMNRLIDVDVNRRIARVQSGALLGDINRELATTGLVFAPDPTSEEECSIGGAIAANASGARSLKYGATRRHVIALTVALASGELLEVRRPDVEKNTAGYEPTHDLVDWFVGSEGTLGVVLEAELRLVERPETVVGFGIPFPSAGQAIAFVAAARRFAALSPRCLEYLDAAAFSIARRSADRPGWAPEAQAFVYAEEENMPDARADSWIHLAEQHGCLGHDIAVFASDSELRAARRMRHAVPATLNERAAQFRPAGGRKVSTDWAVPLERLPDLLEASNRAADAHSVERPTTYGHVGNGHPHQNYVGQSADGVERIERAVEDTLRAVVAAGGTISAQHGIRKLKKRWL